MPKNYSKGVSLCFRIIFRHSQRGFMPFCTVFKKLKIWPKSTKMVRGLNFLLDFGHFFDFLKNGSKRHKTTLGMPKNYSKTKANPFRIIFRHCQRGFMPF